MTLAELDIEAGLFAEIVELDAQVVDAEGRAMLYRDLAVEAMHLLTQARDHALRQGRTIQSLRVQLAQLMGVEPPAPTEDTWL